MPRWRLAPVTLAAIGVLVTNVALLVTPGQASAAPDALPGPGGMSIVTSIIVGGEAGQPIVDAQRNRLYVPDRNAPNVSVIDLASNHITARVVVGKKAEGVGWAILDDRRSRLFVVTVGDEAVDHVVAIDTKTNKVKARIPVARGSHELALDRARSQLYVFTPEADRIQAINTRTLRLVRSTKAPNHALSMALDSVHGWLYFDGYNDQTGLITVINARTWTKAFTIPGPDIGGGSMTLDVAANRLYASLIDDEDPGTMEIYDTKARKTIGHVTVGMWPGEPILDAAHQRIYLSTGNDPDLAVIDTVTNTDVGRINTGGDTHTPVVDAARQRLFAVTFTDEDYYLAMMSSIDNTTIGLIQLGDVLGRPVLDASGRFAYVSGGGSGQVTVVALPA